MRTINAAAKVLKPSPLSNQVGWKSAVMDKPKITGIFKVKSPSGAYGYSKFSGNTFYAIRKTVEGAMTATSVSVSLNGQGAYWYEPTY